MYKLIDGKAIAAEMRDEIKNAVTQFRARHGKDIGLAVVLVGENPASQVYVRNKIKACEEVGIKSFSYYLPANVTQAQLDGLISSERRNEDARKRKYRCSWKKSGGDRQVGYSRQAYGYAFAQRRRNGYGLSQ